MTEFDATNDILVRYTGNGGSVVIPDGIWQIDPCAFRSCAALTSVIIPAGVGRIETEAFCGCTALTEVVLPNSVWDIGFRAFAD